MTLNLKQYFNESEVLKRRKFLSEEDAIEKQLHERIIEKKKFKDLNIDLEFLSKKPKF